MWILQEMPKDFEESTSNYFRTREALKDLGIDFLLVTYSKDNLIVLNNNDYTYLENGNEILEKALGKGFVPKGSVKLVEDLKKYPTNFFYKDHFDFENILDYIPSENLLNIPDTIGFVEDLEPISDFFFVRPLKDNKALNGTIMSRQEFIDFRDNYKEYYYNSDKISSSQFMLCPLKEIKREFRFFIVNGTISSYSQYKEDNKLKLDSVVENKVIDFVNNNLVNLSTHNVVLDVAELENGDLKVIEFNSFYGSGYYKSDVYKIIQDIEEVRNKKGSN